MIYVSPAQVGSLQSILDSAATGTTVRLADGTYPLTRTLVFRVPGVTLRSASGDRSKVIIDGQYETGDVLLLQEPNVTVADLTVTRAYYHPVHVAPNTRTITGTLLHNLRIVDGAEQFIKVNPANGYYADSGVIRCSSLQLTDAGRAQVRNNCYTGGVDIHQARGWQIVANVITGFWCASGLSEHGIHVWTGSRDTVVDRNVIHNSARGIGYGMGQTWANSRTYSDAPCGGAAYVGHYGGSITNNFVSASDSRLFSSAFGFDTGIGLEQSCQTNVLHNSVVSTVAPRSSSIEWRFANTTAVVANNLTTHALKARDGGQATLAGNVAGAPLSMFVNAAAGDLRLASTATAAIDKGATLSAPVTWDIDGATRDSRVDVGADEVATATFAVSLSATSSVPAGGTIAVNWTTTAGSPGSADWIGLFAAGAADTAPMHQVATAGAATGSVQFVAPSTAGSYEARYISGTGGRVAVSNAIVVSAPAPPPPPGDTTAPTVVITSPADGARINKQVNVTVSATDNVGVVTVELYVDGALTATSTVAPFTTRWNARGAARGTHTLQVKAYDAAGNASLSPRISVVR